MIKHFESVGWFPSKEFDPNVKMECPICKKGKNMDENWTWFVVYLQAVCNDCVREKGDKEISRILRERTDVKKDAK